MTEKHTLGHDYAAIAAKLSPSQTKALLAMPERGSVFPKKAGISGRALRNLWDHWIGGYGTDTPISLVHRDVCDYPLSYTYELSKHGEAVRDEIRAAIAKAEGRS